MTEQVSVEENSDETSAFSGIRVMELAQWVFVPVAGALLSDWGADVIKIEHPLTGDDYRGLVTQGIKPNVGGINHSMELANRGKRSIGLDIKSVEGRKILLQLIETADVFLTNFLPSTLDRLDLGLDDLRKVNPNLIYARGHRFGVRGPDASKAAYDAAAFWARGGMGETLTPKGSDMPIRQRGAFGDRCAAAHLAFGIASALLRRERTGVASVVDVSLLSVAIWTLGSDMLSALQGNFVDAPVQSGSSRTKSSNPLVNTFRTSDDRFVTLVFLQPDRYWGDFCRALGRPELEWAPFQRVPEVIEDRQVIANGYIGEVAAEGGNSFRMPTGAVQFDERPAIMRRGPEHGQHTELVLLELGLEWDEITRLKDAGAIV